MHGRKREGRKGMEGRGMEIGVGRKRRKRWVDYGGKYVERLREMYT